MVAAGTGRVTVGEIGADPEGALQHKVPGWAGLLLLVAVAAGLLGQGAYHGPAQRFVGLLVGAAALATMVAWPPSRDDARLLPVVPAAALAAWALVVTVVLGITAAAAAGLVLLLAGVVAVLFVCRRLGREDRDVLLLGVTVTGLLVAVSGWLGVAGRVASLAWEGEGIWRASSTLSYPNAAAAVLVPVALVVLARLALAPGSVPLILAATGLLTGLAATMSRAGAAALLVGPAAGPPRPVPALAGLAAGLALAVVVARLERRRWAVALLLAGVVAGGLGAMAVTGGGGDGEAFRTVADTRVTLASPDRTDAVAAAVRVVAARPLTGAGPGHAQLREEGSDGVTRFFVYAHNEYLQVAAELGLVGLALLALLLAALARLLWRARAAGDRSWTGVVAAASAFAVHSGFDFVWHLPAVVLAMTLLVGAVLPPPPTHSPKGAP